MKFFVKKFNTILNHIDYYRCSLTRPTANSSFSSILNTKIGNCDGKILCEALWDHPHHWLRLAIFRNALSAVYGKNLVGIYEEDISKFVLASLRSLSLTTEEVISTRIPERFYKEAEILLKNTKTASDILELNIAQGYPSHFFYDGILKSEMLGTIDASNKNIIKYLSKTLHYIEQYSAIICKHDIKAVVVSHPTTIRFSTLVWAAIKYQLPVFILNYRNHHITIRKLLNFDDIGYMSEDVPTTNDRDQLTSAQRTSLISSGRRYLKSLYEGTTGEISVTNAFSSNNKVSSKDEVLRILGTDRNKKNIVVLTSCWPDFPNALGRSYFSDHIEWLNLTLKIAHHDRKYNWIFRAHPAEAMYGKKVTLKNILKDKLGENIFMWPENISGSLVNVVADCVVTALGSVGFEYPALGKRSLVARETTYTKWGFSNYANNFDEYKSMLEIAPYLPLPTKRMQEDALIYIALRLTTPDVMSKNYKYPLGRLSYRLWPGIPEFVKENRENFVHEISMMCHWLSSDSNSYNVYKGLHPELWK
jgi:hypothetical protein